MNYLSKKLGQLRLLAAYIVNPDGVKTEKIVNQSLNILDPNNKHSDIYKVRRCWDGVEIHFRGERMVRILKLEQSFGLYGYRYCLNHGDYVREATWGPSKIITARNTVPSLARALRKPFERAINSPVKEEPEGM